MDNIKNTSQIDSLLASPKSSLLAMNKDSVIKLKDMKSLRDEIKY
mgnify:FL=1